MRFRRRRPPSLPAAGLGRRLKRLNHAVRRCKSQHTQQLPFSTFWRPRPPVAGIENAVTETRWDYPGLALKVNSSYSASSKQSSAEPGCSTSICAYAEKVGDPNLRLANVLMFIVPHCGATRNVLNSPVLQERKFMPRSTAPGLSGHEIYSV